MTDPLRWSEAGNAATEQEQALVRAGHEWCLPGAEKAAIWNQILGSLPSPAADPSAQQAAPEPLSPPLKAATISGSGTLLAIKGAKILCVLGALSALGTVGYRQFTRVHSSGAPQRTRAAAPTSALPMAPTAPETHAVPEPLSTSMEAPPTVPSAAQVTPAAHASQLREESLAVMAARQALRSNDAPKALRLLELAQQRFKKGALLEEREALTVEALARTGQSARASTRAQSFLTRYPRSPHAADVQRFIAK